jgi:hypothetical protein
MEARNRRLVGRDQAVWQLMGATHTHIPRGGPWKRRGGAYRIAD